MATKPTGYKTGSVQGGHTIRGRKEASLRGQAAKAAKAAKRPASGVATDEGPSTQRRTKPDMPVAKSKARAQARKAEAKRARASRGDASFRGVIEKIDKGY